VIATLEGVVDTGAVSPAIEEDGISTGGSVSKGGDGEPEQALISAHMINGESHLSDFIS
jgi:hypothetical protein